MAKLKPRARIIRTIGDQLISGPEAAIIELVKNSYDAEATSAEVRFEVGEDDTYSITIKDDGHGMTYDDLVNNWLEPATDVKVKNTQSRNKKRRLLGAKGIGRFAVSRLGEVSVLTSTSLNETSKKFEKSSIYIDWSLFSADRYLEDVDVEIVKEIIDNNETGVEIVITDLRDKWSKKQVERLILELRRLSHPRDEDKFLVFLDLDCFTVENAGFDGKELLLQQNNVIDNSDDHGADTYKQIQPYVVGDICDYKLEGKFDSNGAFEGYFQIQRGDSVKQLIKLPSLVYDDDEESCGEFSIKLNVYDRETESIAKLFERMGLEFNKVGIRRARKILTEISGISIVRNGFRIRPYGDPDHDWLELQAKRVLDPSKKLGSDQVSGFVEIQDETISGVVERSSREGLELNNQYRRLKSLLAYVLPHVEERRFDFRAKAGIGRRPASNVEKAREASKLKQVYKALEKIPEEFKVKLVAAIEKDAVAINTMLDEVDEYQKVLQSRSALGLVVAEVIHEGRRLLDPMVTSIKTLKLDYKHAFEDSKIGELYRENFPVEIEVLKKGGKGLGTLFKRLDPISGRKRGRPVNFRLIDVIKDVLEILKHNIQSSNISINLDIDDEIYCYGYREDMQAVQLNIIENACYWLLHSDENDREIFIEAHVAKSKVVVQMANNGPEIDEGYFHRLFDAGFSLKSDGTGLGLAIARESARASKGDLKFREVSDLTTFIIEFPKGVL